MPILDEVDQLNSWAVTESYVPDQVVLEAPKRAPDDNFVKKAKEEPVKRFDVAGVPAIVAPSVSQSNSSQSSSSQSSSGSYGSGYYGSRYGSTPTTQTVSGPQSDFDKVKSRFDEIRKRAYLEVEQEWKSSRSQVAMDYNPHLEYIKNRGKKANSFRANLKKVFSSNTAKQIGAIVAIIGLQTVVSMLKEEYRNVFTGSDDKSKK